MKKLLFICTLCTTLSLSVQANVCDVGQSVTSQAFDENFRDLQAALDASMEQQELLTADITYSALGIGAGKSKLYLETVGGEIVNLNIDTNVKMAGISFDRMVTKININDFSNGYPLSFRMNGSDHDALIITPGDNFNSFGGHLTIRTWTGKLDSEKRPIYSEPSTLYISADQNRKYSLYQAASDSLSHEEIACTQNKVKSLKINMRGNPMSPESLYANSYTIKTEK